MQRRPYEKWAAYGQAKSANVQFAFHPGGIRTPLQRDLTMEEQVAMGWYDAQGYLNPVFKTVEQGAATSVWCATSPQLAVKGGVY